MPYHIGAKGSYGCQGFPVVKDSDGTVMGCHETQEDAKGQLAAVYANELKNRAKQMETQVEIAEVLKHMREIIGNQAQEIAVLKATLAQKDTPPANS